MRICRYSARLCRQLCFHIKIHTSLNYIGVTKKNKKTNQNETKKEYPSRRTALGCGPKQASIRVLMRALRLTDKYCTFLHFFKGSHDSLFLLWNELIHCLFLSKIRKTDVFCLWFVLVVLPYLFSRLNIGGSGECRAKFILDCKNLTSTLNSEEFLVFQYFYFHNHLTFEQL